MEEQHGYELDYLIKLCEGALKDHFELVFMQTNYVKVILTLALEINYLHKQLDKLGDIVYGVDE